jgi:hypothetical protein
MTRYIIARVPRAYRWLRFICAMYIVGCLVGPFIATAVALAETVSR